MLTSAKSKTNLPTVMRRIRESSGLTMRQAGAMIGISHVAISQFENSKLNLPDYRIEQLVKAYGLSMEDLNRIMGRAPVINHKDDCHAIIDRMDDKLLALIRPVLVELLNGLKVEN